MRLDAACFGLPSDGVELTAASLVGGLRTIVYKSSFLGKAKNKQFVLPPIKVQLLLTCHIITRSAV